MKARFIILVYRGEDYKNTSSVERTNFYDNCSLACSQAKHISEYFSRYVEVWDLIRNKIAWMP